MRSKNRVFRVVVSVVVMLCVAATLTAFPVSARVANGSAYFKYAACATFGSTGDVLLNANNFDFATSSNNDVHFQTYLPSSANIVAFRMELTSVFNNLLTHWYSVVPSMSNASNTNIIYYTFYIVERSYQGRITGSISKEDYIYCVTFNLSSDINGEGIFTNVNIDYGDRYMGRYRDTSINPLPNYDSQCDVIVSLYSPNLRTDFVVNFNLVIACGSGNINDYGDVENGVNDTPSVPDDWRDKLHNDDQLYNDIDIQLDTIMDYISNPATMLNVAMVKTSTALNWHETRAVLACVDSFLAVPLINFVAWAIALFGSVFSLFNLGISFASHSGGGKK